LSASASDTGCKTLTFLFAGQPRDGGFAVLPIRTLRTLLVHVTSNLQEAP
jgi:hypothetical protein